MTVHKPGGFMVMPHLGTMPTSTMRCYPIPFNNIVLTISQPDLVNLVTSHVRQGSVGTNLVNSSLDSSHYYILPVSALAMRPFQPSSWNFKLCASYLYKSEQELYYCLIPSFSLSCPFLPRVPPISHFWVPRPTDWEVSNSGAIMGTFQFAPLFRQMAYHAGPSISTGAYGNGVTVSMC